MMVYSSTLFRKIRLQSTPMMCALRCCGHLKRMPSNSDVSPCPLKLQRNSELGNDRNPDVLVVLLLPDDLVPFELAGDAVLPPLPVCKPLLLHPMRLQFAWWFHHSQAGTPPTPPVQLCGQQCVLQRNPSWILNTRNVQTKIGQGTWVCAMQNSTIHNNKTNLIFTIAINSPHFSVSSSGKYFGSVV